MGIKTIVLTTSILHQQLYHQLKIKGRNMGRMMGLPLMLSFLLSMYYLENYRYFDYHMMLYKSYDLIHYDSYTFPRNLYSFYWLTLQMYFDKIAELTMSRSDTPLFKEALVSLAKDSGLHPLVPYFSYFIADEVVN